ncbi:MAG TPA: TIM barrel protein [Dehalococcoidales bacterium]|nr:TIM barrel protein [Dehalococcoidales bacterium]
MDGLLFGTAGTPRSTRNQTTIDGIERIAELGLDCMELEFVQGVRMGEGSARLVAGVASREGVRLSAHAPYFINLNAREPEKIRASQDRILQAARIAALCGAESVTFHAAFYLGDPPGKTYNTVKKYLGEILNQLGQENIRVRLSPEVTGKASQFGTIDELLNLSAELEGVAPCIDFAHWHARTGKFNSYPEFTSILRQVEERLGRAALDDMHIHVSGVKYGGKGEISHLNLGESDLRYVELLSALKDYSVKGIVICESPNLEEDALLLQTTYNSL